jgi:hypothetical protein
MAVLMSNWGISGMAGLSRVMHRLVKALKRSAAAKKQGIYLIENRFQNYLLHKKKGMT